MRKKLENLSIIDIQNLIKNLEKNIDELGNKDRISIYKEVLRRK